MDAQDQERLAFYRKNIEEGRVDARMSTRIFAGVADGLLTWLLSIILFSATIFILLNGGLSKELGTLMGDMQAESVASGLILYDKDGAAESDLVRQERYVKNILAYEGAEAPTDELYHYYCVYESKGKEATPVSDFNKNILKIGAEDSYFEAPATYGVLKQEWHDLLYQYYNAEKTAEAINAHTSLVNFYTEAHNAAWAEFRGAEPYATTLSTYMQKATAMYLSIGGFHIGCYLISAMVCYYLIPAIKKRGTTFGKKVLHIEPVMMDGNPITLPAIFARGSIEILLNCWAIPLSGFFIYGFDSLTVPFIAIGGFVLQLSVFFLAGFILSIASLIFAMVRKDNRALTDLAAGTWVITGDVVQIRNAQAELKQERREEQNGGE
ncbi:MAG: RDD family protein [Bacilli bacterium]|nr:RDD family protein [Bacilli bacterium]